MVLNIYIANGFRLELIWVPGHQSTEDEERADECAVKNGIFTKLWHLMTY